MCACRCNTVRQLNEKIQTEYKNKFINPKTQLKNMKKFYAFAAFVLVAAVSFALPVKTATKQLSQEAYAKIATSTCST